MNPTEFKEQMDKLLIFYRDLPPGSEPIYWKTFKDTSAKTFVKACDIIINTYDKTTFPIIPVFNAAIDLAVKDRSSSVMLTSNCPYCRGVGLTIIEAKGSSGVAHPCSCHLGQIYQRSFDRARIRIESKQHRVEKEKQESEFIQQSIEAAPDSTLDPY